MFALANDQEVGSQCFFSSRIEASQVHFADLCQAHYRATSTHNIRLTQRAVENGDGVFRTVLSSRLIRRKLAGGGDQAQNLAWLKRSAGRNVDRFTRDVAGTSDKRNSPAWRCSYWIVMLSYLLQI